MIKGPTWLRTVAYVTPAVRPTPQAQEGPAPDGNAPPVQPSGTPRAGTALTWAARRAGRGARWHSMLLILLAAGLGLRVVTQLAYRPAIFYIDSYKYLRGSGGYDPVGYNLLLKPILWAGNLATIAAVQHMLGLAMAVLLLAGVFGAMVIARCFRLRRSGRPGRPRPLSGRRPPRASQRSHPH